MRIFATVFVSVWLLVGTGLVGAAPNVDEYLAASTRFDALVADAAQKRSVPRISDEQTAAVIAILSDTKLVSSDKWQIEDLGLLLSICGKANAATMTYLLFDDKAYIDPKSAPEVRELQFLKLIQRNTESFQDELTSLQPFLVRCLATQVPLLTSFYVNLKAEEITDVRRRGLQNIRGGAISMYFGMLSGSGNTRISEAYELRMFKALAESASVFAQVLKVEDRKQLVNLATKKQLDAPGVFHPYLAKIAEAMRDTSCDGLCAFSEKNLFEAAANGDLNLVKSLLDAKADVNSKEGSGFTALFIASQNGHSEVVRALLDAKANVNAKSRDGVTALIIASQNGHSEVVRALLDAKADVNAEFDGVTALLIAAQNGFLEVVRALLDAKADVNAKRRDGVTALIIASHKGYLEIVRALLSAKADVNAKRNNGATALIFASQNGYLEIVRALLGAKADVNAKRDDGATALMGASNQGYREVVRALLDAKADVNVKRDDGATALMAASNQGYLEIVRALLSAKADVNAKTNDGHTALIIALQKGHSEVVQLLKEAGAKE